MSSRQIKILILAIPTITIGLWEYLRHTILLPYLSMNIGNWLSPILIFLVTVTLLTPLFQAYERLEQELKHEREAKQLMAERERIARELHDGIAQTLFLSSVQVEQLKTSSPEVKWEELQHSLYYIQEYVRRLIYTLKSENQLPMSAKLHLLKEQFQFDTGIKADYHANFQEKHFSPKESWELLSCIKESLTNIRKHAHASEVQISLTSAENSWELIVADNGQGFSAHSLHDPKQFGLRMMQERAAECGATFSLFRENKKTIVKITKGVQ